VVFGRYQCDLVVHGDDPCLDIDGSNPIKVLQGLLGLQSRNSHRAPEHVPTTTAFAITQAQLRHGSVGAGNDVYATSKAVGKYREIKRTEGVSTTDLVGRMLSMSRTHHEPDSFSAGFTSFMPTSRRVAEFSSARRPKHSDTVVYVDGAFDLLHPAQVDFLRSARALGDYLIVGVHKDHEVNKYKGSNFPIMNLHERMLAVLSCRYVDEVVIGAPWTVTDDIITTFNISVVAHGTFYDETKGGQKDYEDAYKYVPT
jgi:cytidyltransferase-like protein